MGGLYEYAVMDFVAEVSLVRVECFQYETSQSNTMLNEVNGEHTHTSALCSHALIWVPYSPLAHAWL